jgi:hypothetical protein
MSVQYPGAVKCDRRPAFEQSAADRQLLTPPEEGSLVAYILRMSCNKHLSQVKHLRRSVSVLLSLRVGSRGAPDAQVTRTLSGKDWPQVLNKRHPELMSPRLQATNCKRHEKYIYRRILKWFATIGPRLQELIVLKGNKYNMDDTGIMLRTLGSLKVLVGRDELRNYRDASVNYTMIIAEECICVDGQALSPLIIWLSVTQVSSWTSHTTPDQRFACSGNRYMNYRIDLEWIQQVFNPLT